MSRARKRERSGRFWASAPVPGSALGLPRDSGWTTPPEAIWLVPPYELPSQKRLQLWADARLQESHNDLDDVLERRCFQCTDLRDHEGTMGGE